MTTPDRVTATPQAVDGPDRQALAALLGRHGWNVARAAAELCVSRMTLYRRMQRLGVDRPRS
jgi:transcriptional regulator of acetoin/glycerol metabolism